MNEPDKASTRRRFLEYLAASPFVWPLAHAADEFVPTKPEEAVNVMDFEAAARKRVPPAHFGYIATGVEDDLTLRANRDAFQHYQLRPRRLIDVTKVDTSVKLFGKTWEYPLILAPAGSQKAFHEEGELGVARAAGSRKTLQILSTMTTVSIEDINAAQPEPAWSQLYATSKWEYTEKMIRRAEAAGSKVLVVTVDLPGVRKTETEQRYRRLDTRPCAACHPAPGGPTRYARKPMFTGLDMNGVSQQAPAMTWESIEQMRKVTSMKIMIKGILTHEDASLARKHGIDGVIVSNHGGRAEESGMGALDCLPEVVDAAGREMVVLVDGGFRRGSDMFKALALGARAVCIGRPYLWGLGAFGQPGVEAVIDMLRKEFTTVMKQCGTRSIAEIKPEFIRHA